MKELRYSESHPEKVYDTLIQVLKSLGFRGEEVAREGWSYNPKTGYLRFKAFVLDEDGAKQIDPHKSQSVKIKRVRKLKPFWRARMDYMLELYGDERVKGVPR